MAGNFPLGNPFGAMSAGAPDLDPQVAQMLQTFGVGMPQQTQQPGPFENMQGMDAAHPALAKGLDNALIATSLMGPTGATAGENISNVARGVLGVGNYRRQFAAQQAMLPFQYADAMGKLQKNQADVQELKDRGEYYRSFADQRSGQNQQRMNAALLKAQVDSGKNLQLFTDANGKEVVRQESIDPQTLSTVWNDTGIDPQDFKAEHLKNKVSNRFGGGLGGAAIGNSIANAYGGYDKIPDVVDPKIMAGALRDYAQNSPGFVTNQNRESTVPQSDVYNHVMAANTQALKGMKFNIGNREAAIKAERTRIMRGTLDAGAQNLSMSDIDKQAAAQVDYYNQHDEQLDSLYGQYAQLPMEIQMTVPFQQWAQRAGGYDNNSRTFSTHTQQPAPQAGGSSQYGPSLNQQAPPAGPQGLSPAVQAIINSLGK